MNRLAAAAAAFALLAAGVLLLWRPWQDDLPDDAALKVGDEVVSIDDLNARNDSLRALYGIQQPGDAEGREEFRRQAAKSMAIGIVLDRAVDDRGIEVEDQEVERALNDFVRAQFDGSRQIFLDSLGNVGTSETAVREEVQRQLELRMLLQEVAGEVKVDRRDLRAAFSERKSELDLPARREVSNIVVQGRREAARVRSELDDGADVASLARTHSIDGATREAGGALGEVGRADLVPAVARAVFSTPAGEPYGPAKGPQGWNIGIVTRVLPAEPATFAGARGELRKQLVAEKTQARWSEWLTERLREADIEYAADYRPDDPDDVTTWQQEPGGQEPGRQKGAGQ